MSNRVPLLPEEFLERIRRKSTIVTVIVRPFEYIGILVRDTMQIVCFTPFCVGQQLISLFYFNEFLFCTRIITFVGMPALMNRKKILSFFFVNLR